MALVPWSAASAATGSEVFVSVTNEPNSAYPAGTLTFDSATAHWLPNQETSSGNQIDFSVDDNVNGIGVTLTAPNGSTLQPGAYDHTIAGANDAGQTVDGSRPGLNVVEGDSTCTEEEGSFDLHSFTVDTEHPLTNGEYRLTSLWVTFRMRCLIPDAHAYLTGEVRWNVPGDGGSLVVGPQDVMWPDEEPDAVPVTSPVTIFNPSANPVQIGTASVTGADASDDTITADACSGTTLAAGDSCQLTVSYKSVTPGSNEATLEVPEVGGPVHAVALHGYVFSGTTDITLQSQPGDYLAKGKNWEFTPSTGPIVAEGSYHWAGIGLDYNTADGYGSFGVGVEAPQGQQLTQGVTYANTSNDPNTTGPFLNVQGPVGYCDTETGTFTITDIYIDPYGDVGRLGLTFDVHCNNLNDTGDLQGTVEYQLNALSVSVRNGSVRVAGEVAPNEPGKNVTVELEKKGRHGFVPFGEKGLKLDRASRYRARFHRSRAKVCRAVATFKARRKHLGSRTVEPFRC